MAIINVNPYLHFNGSAQSAIQLYEQVLGASTKEVVRLGGGPNGRVAHSVLEIGGHTIMVSDTMVRSGAQLRLPNQAVAPEGGVQVSIDFDDPTDLADRFGALAAGGQVAFPVSETFFATKFGMLTDAFGIRWMFNCPNKKS